MANPENLKGHEFTSDQDREEAARNGRKGGVASGAVRRERKKMREALEDLLSRTYTDKDTGRQLDGVTMLMVSAVSKAQRGDIRALEFIRGTLGEDPVKMLDVTGNLRSEQARFSELLEQLDDPGE